MKKLLSASLAVLGFAFLFSACNKDDNNDDGGVVKPDVTVERVSPTTDELPAGYAEIGQTVKVKVKVSSNVTVESINVVAQIGSYSLTLVGDTNLMIFEVPYEVPFILPTGDTLTPADVLSIKATATDKNNNSGSATLDLQLGNRLSSYSQNPQTQENFRVWHKFSSKEGAFDLRLLVPKTVNDDDAEKDLEDASKVGRPVTGDLWAGYDDQSGTIINKTKFVKVSKTPDQYVLDAQIRKDYMDASVAPVSKIKVETGDVYAVKLRGKEEYVLLHIKEVNTTDASATTANNKGYVEFEVKSALY